MSNDDGSAIAYCRTPQFHRILQFPPGIESALERPDMSYAFISEEQRHTGAGGFVWSSTVENDFAVARQPFIGYLQFASVHPKSAGNRFRVGFEIHGVAQVYDRKNLASV